MNKFTITEESVEEYVKLRDAIDSKINSIFSIYAKEHSIRYNFIENHDLGWYRNGEYVIKIIIDTSIRYGQESETKYIPLRWLYATDDEVSREIKADIAIKKQKELALKAEQELKQLEQDRIDYERLKEEFGDLQ